MLLSLTEFLPFLLLACDIFVWNTGCADVDGNWRLQTAPKKLSADALKNSKITDQSVPSSLAFVCPCLSHFLFYTRTRWKKLLPNAYIMIFATSMKWETKNVINIIGQLQALLYTRIQPAEIYVSIFDSVNIPISGYIKTSLIIASGTFKEKSVFATLLRRYYFGSFHLSHETTRCL